MPPVSPIQNSIIIQLVMPHFPVQRKVGVDGEEDGKKGRVEIGNYERDQEDRDIVLEIN